MTDEKRERELRRIKDESEREEYEGNRVREQAEDDARRVRDEEARATAEARLAKELVEESAYWDSVYFPPAVSVRIDPKADIADAQALLPVAKQVFHRANALQQAGQQLVKLFRPGTDGSLIYAYLHGPVKHVYIQPGPRPKPVPTKEEIERERRLYACPDMLSGIVHRGDPVVISTDPISGISQYAVHEFHPTQSSATLYSLDFSWKDVARFGVTSDPVISSSPMQVRFPKPSMYSGAMKRIVQAVYGIAKSSYVDEQKDPNALIGFNATNHYDYRWQRTDGVHRIGNVFWLIRIERDLGVLAMKLPLFECSKNAAFGAALQDIGDPETAAIVREFGGLPSGETFPTGDSLARAIENKSVLQLISAVDLRPFYYYEGQQAAGHETTKEGFFEGCGWAFSNTGAATEVHNTCRYYSRRDIALATWWEGGWYLDGHANAPASDRFMRAEHWKITLNLTATVPHATLELVEMQPLEAPNTFGLSSYVFTEKIGHFHSWSTTAPGGGSFIDSDQPYDPFGGGAYVAPSPLGYGLGIRTRFNTSQEGFAAFGNYGSGGDISVTPFRPSYSVPLPDGHVNTFAAITGPGALSVAEAPRLANVCVFYGFNPLDYVAELRSVITHENPTNAANSHALFWTHSALMLVPSNSPTSTLQRCTFWGRSQVSLPIDEMEPAYAAPVFVFYVGETLEKVYRQAERWQGGHYTMGDFWSTSLDLRINSTYGTYETLPGPGYINLRYIQNMPDPEGHIGLIIPQGVREGYVFLRSIIGSGSVGNPSWATETKPIGFFALNGATPRIVDYTNYAWDGDMSGAASPFGDSGTIGLLYEVQLRWHFYWVSLYAGAKIKMTVAINAQTGEFIYEHEGPLRDWNPFDHNLSPFFMPEYVTRPPIVPREGYPRYRINLPPGIALPFVSDFGVDPVDITFVGGV